jgi:hypothetical protein
MSLEMIAVAGQGYDDGRLLHMHEDDNRSEVARETLAYDDTWFFTDGRMDVKRRDENIYMHASHVYIIVVRFINVIEFILGFPSYDDDCFGSRELQTLPSTPPLTTTTTTTTASTEPYSLRCRAFIWMLSS